MFNLSTQLMKNQLCNIAITISLLTVLSCNQTTRQQDDQQVEKMQENSFEQGSFGYDVQFLQERDSSMVILRSEASQVIVSSKYQAKVFTSSAAGDQGISFGWINYEAFDADPDPHMNAYGGENRFWLGPEGSRYSLFFESGSPMVYDNWKTPPPIDTEAWEVSQKSTSSVSMTKEMSLVNYAGTQLDMKADREVRILSRAQIEQMLGISTAGVESVGFVTENAITNTGTSAWTKETGAPSIWILDMFVPSDQTVIFIPYEQEGQGKVVTSDYFGQIPEDRLKYEDGKLFFHADGKSRGKLGLSPQRSKPVAGSYDSKNRIFTITTFDLDKNAIYLNQEWTPDKDPYQGDAINAYNDGPLEDGGQMGPFYEIESVSPAAFLAPRETLTHQHNVFHFHAEEQELDQIAQQVLGVSLEEIKQAF